jgi:aspartyl-tRNA(Asn)/glutamyl-tRNA(Gln) amidotransferase subunit C
MTIAKDQIVHVAKLARLHLDDAAVELYTTQLGDVLAYMDTLNRLDTKGVAPTSHAIMMNNAFREDEIKSSMPVKLALANAPEAEEEGFVVPKVIG